MIDINNRNQGSAKRLEGDIYVLCFYVGTPSNPVNERVHVPWTQELFEAEAWLKRQAAHWGKSLDFTNATYGINGEITFLPEVIPTDPAKADAFFFPETVYRAQHFKDGWDVSEFIRKNLTDCDQWISIILCNLRGRSFACPVNERLVSFDDKKFFLESCVVFRNDAWPPFNKTTSASLAHEILHLFGASDLYAHNKSEWESETEYRRRYPNSIMLGSPYGLSKNEMDETTAWLVGWTDRMPVL